MITYKGWHLHGGPGRWTWCTRLHCSSPEERAAYNEKHDASTRLAGPGQTGSPPGPAPPARDIGTGPPANTTGARTDSVAPETDPDPVAPETDRERPFSLR